MDGEQALREFTFSGKFRCGVGDGIASLHEFAAAQVLVRDTQVQVIHDHRVAGVPRDATFRIKA